MSFVLRESSIRRESVQRLGSINSSDTASIASRTLSNASVTSSLASSTVSKTHTKRTSVGSISYLANSSSSFKRSARRQSLLKLSNEFIIFAKEVVPQEKKKDFQGFELNKLNLKGLGFYGRSDEVSGLLKSLETFQNPSEGKAHSSMIVSISGGSGVGKSALAQQLRKPVTDQGGIFATGKFCQQNRHEPYTAFAVLFTELCDAVLAGDNSNEVIKKIQEAIAPVDREVIIDIAKKFNVFFDDQEVKEDGKDQDAEEVSSSLSAIVAYRNCDRLNFLFRKLMRVVCSFRQVVFLLDDVQWADTASMHLIEALLTDFDNSALLLVTTHRDNEVTQESSFMKLLDSCRMNHLMVREIPIGNLGPEAVNSIVSSLLRSTNDDTESLSEIIRKKTHGNPFFVIEFLKTLVEDGELHYDLNKFSWQWSEDKIQQMSSTINVATLMSNKLKKLPKLCHLVLGVAANFGQTFELDMLSIVIEDLLESGLFLECDVDDEVSRFVELCIDEELLVHRPTPDEPATYSFIHDYVQSAAMELIPGEDQKQLQLLIGRSILSHSFGTDLEKNLLLAVDLLNKGSDFVDDNDKIDLANINLLAGDTAVKKSAFGSAAMYFESGLSYIDIDDWSEYRELKLDLTNGAAECYFYSGNNDKMEAHLQRVALHEADVKRNILPHLIKLMSLGSQQRFEEGVAMGLQRLKELGFNKLPSSASSLTVAKELAKTKLLLRKHTKESLLSLPLLTDEKRIKALSILYTMKTHLYCSNPHLLMVSYLIELRWAVRYGICLLQIPAFALYSVLNCRVDNFKEAAMFVELSHALCLRLGSKEIEPRIIAIAYAYGYHWTKPLNLCEKPLLYGYQSGSEVGDPEYAMFNLYYYDGALFLTGSCRLDKLAEDMKSHTRLMDEYRQEIVKNLSSLRSQLVLNLVGKSTNPLILTGDEIDEEKMIQLAKEKKNYPLLGILYSYRMVLAYIFGEYESAGEYAELSRDVGVKVIQGHFYVPFHTFFRGLSFLALAEQGRKSSRTYLGKATKVLKKMRRWVKLGNVNCLNKTQLLEAEFAAIKGQNDVAEKLYKDSIRTAGQFGLICDKALAHARLGLFHLKISEESSYWAEYHLQKSIECYEEWGANAVVDYLKNKYPFLILS